MKKLLKTVIVLAVVVTVLTVLAIFRPWQYLNKIAFIGEKSAITVNSTSGKSEVYLDGKKLGETPLSTENLQSGDYVLKIKRLSEEKDFYFQIEDTIHLEADTRTFIEVEIGPSEQFSSIKKVYYKTNNTSATQLLVSSTPGNATVWVDDVRYGETPITDSSIKSGRHDLKIEAPGYEALETTIIARDGYTLVAEMQLMAKPFEITLSE